MKNSSPFLMKSKFLFGISLVLLFAGIYLGVFRKSTEVAGLTTTNLKIVTLSEDNPVGFVRQGNGSSPSDTDLIKTYSQLYGKFQVKAFANHKFAMPTDLEIEALRVESNALDQLYTKMTLEERRKVKRISFPYAKLEVAGKVTYKRFEELTQKERESLRC